MGKIRIHKGRPVWIPTVTERFNAMIKDKFIDMITDTSEPLTHNDFLFRDWLGRYNLSPILYRNHGLCCGSASHGDAVWDVFGPLVAPGYINPFSRGLDWIGPRR